MQLDCTYMAGDVKGKHGGRTRRAEQGERTRLRILEAATALFDRRGYTATTIEAIAAEADVAVETVYGRFGNKVNLLRSILDRAIAGNDDTAAILDRPEVTVIREEPDQAEQVRLLARVSRTILERTGQAHRILRSAMFSDPAAFELASVDRQRRHRTQTAFVELLSSNKPLRPELSISDAADTYAVLANPQTFALLVGEQGWSPEKFERWLADSLTRLLL